MSESNSGSGRVSREQRGHILLIGLDRAGKRNAFDSAMLVDLALALGEYERNDDLRSAVLFAHGDHFTSGLDLMELAPKLSSGQFGYPEDGIDPFGVSGPRRTKPLVTAVRGTCFTAGIELALNADVAIAATDTRFAQLEVQRGILPSGGASVRFVAAAGWSDAMRYMLTGDEFNAEQAQRMRLVSEIVAPDQLQERAVAIAARIAQAAPLGVRALLRNAHMACDEGSQKALASVNQELFAALQSEDVREGVLAMMQKREPVFKGR